jgi:prefoldin subunit 5
MFTSKKFKKIIEQMNDLNNNLYELSKKINRLEGDLHELRRKMLYRTQIASISTQNPYDAVNDVFYTEEVEIRKAVQLILNHLKLELRTCPQNIKLTPKEEQNG